MNEVVLIMKTVSSSMESHNGFLWPKSGYVHCDTWDSFPICGNGLHGFLWGEGDMGLITHYFGKWLVLEVNKKDIIDLGGKVKFPSCSVIYCGDMIGAAKVILKVRPDSCCPGSGREYIFKNFEGHLSYFKDGLLHRDDGPAVIYRGIKKWYKAGLIHREDGPAEEYGNGDLVWVKKGVKHREDGPACEFKNGDKHWYINGLRHREDGPAVEESNGTKKWFFQSKLHRLDGPAIEFSTGQREWWVRGERHRVEGPAIEGERKREYWVGGVWQGWDGKGI